MRRAGGCCPHFRFEESEETEFEVGNIHPEDINNMSSLWLRAMRYLFEKGSPLPKPTFLTVPTPGKDGLPFGALAETENKRLLFWPAMPRDLEMLSEDGKMGATDHVTLELSNNTIHVTSFNAAGEREHHSDGWCLQHFRDKGVAYWFSFLIKWSILEEWDRQPEVRVMMPPTDTQRRTDLFAEQASRLQIQPVVLPPDEIQGDYLFCAFYLHTDLTLPCDITSEMLVLGDINKPVSGWPDESSCAIQPQTLDIGESRLTIAVASPPGTLRRTAEFGFPMR